MPSHTDRAAFAPFSSPTLPSRLTANTPWGDARCTTATHTHTIGAQAYVDGYRDAERFEACCRACKRYGQTWACPPFDDDAVKEINGARSFQIVGTQLRYDEATRQMSTTVRRRDIIMHLLIRRAIEELGAWHRHRETIEPQSRSYLFSACTLCDPQPCTRPQQQPCRHPDKVRPSLESLGFNLALTAQQLLHIPLKWSSDEQLPEYTLLITAQLV